MNPSTLKEKMIELLSEIQADSGLECPRLTGETKPVGDIPRFDSKIWPVATTLFSIEISASIPNNVNIFIDETSKLPRSIDEVIDFVCTLLTKQADKEVSAA